MTTQVAPIRKFVDEAELEEAINVLWPADPALSLEDYRLRRAQQSLLAEAGRVLQMAFCFSEGAVERIGTTLMTSGMFRPSGSGARDRITVFLERPESPRFVDSVTIRGVRECRPNAVAAMFATALYESLADAFVMARHRGGHNGAEMLTLALEESTTIAFLKCFIEEPLYPLAEMMAGYVPFRGGFLRAKALGQWMRRIPGATFEGSALRTGLVLDTSQKPLPTNDPTTALFKTPIPITDVFGSKQDLVLADGRSSFLLVRTDMKVHGIVIADTPIEIDYMKRGVSMPLEGAPSVERLWIQSIDHRRLSLYGTLPDGSLIHVADIQNGALRLRDPKADFDHAVTAVEGVVDEEAREFVRPLMNTLMDRTMAGRGAVVVIGQRPRHIDIRRTLEPGIKLTRVAGDWQSLLNPDGVALLSPSLEVVAVGGFIKNIASMQSPNDGFVGAMSGAGTRHAASAKATQGRRNVAIAISDDKTLTIYQGGARLIRIGY
jgi:hypothetical protein